jgi:chorismate synthase
MSGNSFGKLFKITTFGESHGNAVGVVIDGCPSNLTIDIEYIHKELQRRKPGQSAITTTRHEEEVPEVISGIFEGKSTGAPICIIVRNKDQRPQDYETLKDTFRPSHADFTYQTKYGIRDFRGSGRASARETLARVIGGAIAKIILAQHKISVNAFVSTVGQIACDNDYQKFDLSKTDSNIVRCPDEVTAEKMIALIEEIKQSGNSVGGAISCIVKGVPAGLGEPVFDKLHAELGKAILSINACKGFEIGSGFDGCTKKGSEQNDEWEIIDNKPVTKTNNSGGIQGGISNGNDIYFRCAFKPASTIAVSQQTLNKNLESVTLEAKGRHDPCVVPRAVPIVEAMTAIVIVDFLMQNQATKFN